MELKKRIIKRENFLGKGLLSDLWIPIIIILSFLYFSGKGENDFNILVKMISATLSLLISVIVYCKIPSIKNDFLKYLGIGFFYVGVIKFSEILLINSNTDKYLKATISVFSSYFEYIIIICSLILYKKKIGLLLSNIIFIINLILIFIVSNFTVVKFILNNLSIINEKLEFGGIDYIYIIIIVIMVIIITSIVAVHVLLTDKNINHISDKVWLVKILILFSAYNILSCLEEVIYIDLNYIQKICMLIAYGIAYMYVEQKLLNNSYREVSNDLIGIQKIRRTMNNNLIKKERNLIESRINIKKSQQRYKEIIESISDGIIIFENYKVVYINKNGVDYIYDKLIGQSNELELKYIIKLLANIELDNENINGGFTGEFIIKNKKKENQNISLTLRNISDTEDILLIKNITDSNELEKLRQKRDKAVVMETIKDEFYSNISHELRTPINVINSGLQLNNVMLKENKLDMMIKNNIIIRQNCLRLIRTINNFIDTNKISEGFVEPNKKIYNIVSIVENVALASNKYMLLKGTELIFDTQLENIYVECDIDHIERIMLNILSNSLKYGKFGGNIDVEIKCNKYEVSILVKNDAPPIPDGKKSIIFEKFTKLDSSLARPSEGSGLGLYLSKELVELNNGYIQMHSNNESGNIFEIRFPIKLSEEYFEENIENNEHNLQEKVNIEFSDIYFQ